MAVIDGRKILRYELYLTNHARNALRLTEIEVIDAVSDRAVATLDAAAIAKTVVRIGRTGEDSALLAPGDSAMAYIDLTISGGKVPDGLRHRVTIKGAAADHRILTGAIPVATDAGPLLAAPLRGGPWVALYDPAMTNGHRRVIYAIDGRARVPGRYAIDWMAAKGFDALSAGESAVSPDGVGADVLAVADGIVRTVKDGFPTHGKVPSSNGVEEETGNMVVLDIGGGRFAFYEHLAQNIPVRPGQRVRRGATIGQVGASGHVTAAHLHFHIADGYAPLSAEGMPYRFAQGEVVGAYASIDAFVKALSWRASSSSPIAGELPEPVAVMMFPPRTR
ncbi:M23 family metallopeptidase [Sphingomonas oleivorans]|uniref:M23 family metallopeptidase n=1 Tax=Sphingomonas oleivorans TaxID=1735121 RepID=UPI0013FDF265|nr:M23 family metallopeptidase [Sphingomonas oleivorans]